MKPNKEDEKVGAIKTAGVGDVTDEKKVKRQRRTPSNAPSKKELQSQLDMLKAKYETIEVQTESVAMITLGFCAVLEGVTKLPFTAGDKKAKLAMDTAGAQAITYYGGDSLGKWAPLAQFGLCASLYTLDVWGKRKKTEKPVDESDNA